MLAQSSRILATASSNAIGRRFASTIALKYSQAAYNAALSKSPQTLTKVHTELASVAQSIKDTPALDAFVNNPLLPAKERAAGLEAIYKAAAGKTSKEPVSDVTRNLFTVLSENGRLAETQGVIEGFNELVSKYKGELDVIVTSAAPLPKDVLTRLESTLKQSEAAKQAKVVRVSNKVRLLPARNCCTSQPLIIQLMQVNPSVLGGFVIDVGDKTIDLSVSSRVNKLNSLLQRMCCRFNIRRVGQKLTCSPAESV